MFETLVNVVFPSLGDFFGRLSALASTSTNTAFLWLFNAADEPVILDCINVFTGISFQAFPPVLGGNFFGWLISVVVYPLYSAINIWVYALGVGSLPFWAGLLIMLVSSFMLISIIRFFVSLKK